MQLHVESQRVARARGANGAVIQLVAKIETHAFVGELGARYPHFYADTSQVRFIPAWFLDGWDEARSDDCLTDGFLDRLRKLPGLVILTCRTAVLASIRQPTKLDTHVDPNRLYTLRDLGIWDLIYEHPCYFSPGSLACTFQRAGFAVQTLYPTFAEQFLCVEAKPATLAVLAAGECGEPPDVAPLADYVARFATTYQRQLAHWRQELDGTLPRAGVEAPSLPEGARPQCTDKPAQ